MPVLDPRSVVYRRFSPSRLMTGLAAVGMGIGIPVVILGPGHVDTTGVLAVGAGLVAAGVGLSLVLRPRADWCARCRRPLEPTGLRLEPGSVAPATAALKAGDVAHALRVAGPPVARGKWVTVWYCPACRSTALWKAGGEPVVVSGGEALVDAVLGKR